MSLDSSVRQIVKPTIGVRLYADETFNRFCSKTKTNWHYIIIIAERLDKSLLQDLIYIRYLNNFDKNSPYYAKNDKILHWSKIKSADEKNICKRWFEYISNPKKSGEKFFCYILGLNESYLNDEEFDRKNKFGSIYNRFFRSAINYALKCFFPNENYEKLIIKNIYHEQGAQKNHKYFRWHSIEKLKKEVDYFVFETSEIEFLEKDHKKDNKANILQLCDCFLGAVVNIIHGLKNPESYRSKIKIELLDLISHLVENMINDPQNKNNEYSHANRIMVRFFPKEKTTKDNRSPDENYFYTKRDLIYVCNKKNN